MNHTFGYVIQIVAILTMLMFGTFHLLASFNATQKNQYKLVWASGTLGLALIVAAIVLRFI